MEVLLSLINQCHKIFWGRQNKLLRIWRYLNLCTWKMWASLREPTVIGTTAKKEEHYNKMQKYKLHLPWLSKTWVPLTQEKDIDDPDGRYGNNFWPDQRERRENLRSYLERSSCMWRHIPTRQQGHTSLNIHKRAELFKRDSTTSGTEANAAHRSCVASTQELMNRWGWV